MIRLPEDILGAFPSLHSDMESNAPLAATKTMETDKRNRPLRSQATRGRPSVHSAFWYGLVFYSDDSDVDDDDDDDYYYYYY